MSDELTFLGTMGEDYTVSLMDSQRLGRLLKKYVETEKPLEITISIFRRQRSKAQNAWMWGVCVPTIMGWLKDTQGMKYTKDEVYYYINSACLGRKTRIKAIGGEEIIILEGKRFSQMTTLEFSDAVDEISLYFSDRGLEIPMPKKGSNNLISNYLKDDNE